jgi:FkbM family methyltransferase
MLKSIARQILNRSPLAALAKLHAEMLGPTLRGRRWRAAHRWSQHEEDGWLVRELAGSIADGFYVDVGANHPAKLSNTYRLYNLGMRGICVEPNDVLCRLIRRYRPGDEVVCAGVGPEDTAAPFYEMWRHDFSTFSETEYQARVAYGLKLRRRIDDKPILRLATILDRHRPSGRSRFELLSVDVEGWDEQVLRGNDWSRFRPRLVVVESNTEAAAASTTAFLASVDYVQVASFEINGIFRDTRAAQGS